MKRNAILCSILIATLGASYVSWTNADDSSGDALTNVPVFQANERDINMITWESPSQSVVAARRTDAKGDYTWITVTERPQPPEPPNDPTPDEDADPEVDAAQPDSPLPEPTVVSFVGNETSEKLWKNVSPLRALRALSNAGELDESVLAFDETATTLTLGKESERITLAVGGETYGAKDRFVRHADNVFLVDDATFRPLVSPKSQLVEHRLFPLQEADIQHVDVQHAGQRIRYVQNNRDDRALSFWADAELPETENQGAGLWLGKVFRLRVKEYVGQPVASATPVFSFTVHGEADTWDVEVLQHTEEDGGETYYARSSLTRGVVELTRSLTADVVEDLGNILE